MTNTQKLWSKNGFIDDQYALTDTLDGIGNRRAILPLALYLQQIEEKGAQSVADCGVLIAADENVEDILPYLGQLPVIALDIPIYNDGRAYSKAARLKSRYQYQGEIRAVGDILIDQVSHMLRAGFDTLVVTHALTQQRLAENNMAVFSGYYQPGNGLKRTESQRRWRA